MYFKWRFLKPKHTFVSYFKPDFDEIYIKEIVEFGGL